LPAVEVICKIEKKEIKAKDRNVLKLRVNVRVVIIQGVKITQKIPPQDNFNNPALTGHQKSPNSKSFFECCGTFIKRTRREMSSLRLICIVIRNFALLAGKI